MSLISINLFLLIILIYFALIGFFTSLFVAFKIMGYLYNEENVKLTNENYELKSQIETMLSRFKKGL